MENNSDKKNEGPACGCGGGNGCSGPGKWIWIVLALAVAAVLVVKNAGEKGAPATPAVNMSSTGGNSANANAVMQEKTLPRLVDLGAGKCIPCKMMAPILEDLKKTYAGKIDVQFVDVWQNPDAGTKFGINVIPTQIFYDAQGKELFRHEGFFGKDDILAKWKELGVNLSL